jgi:transposase-like protein
VADFTKELVMKRRTWESKTKAKVVLEGLAGRPVAEICNQYQISQNQYYQWRDKFLAEAYRAFDSNGQPVREQRLKERIAHLERTLGAVTFELKKIEEDQG